MPSSKQAKAAMFRSIPSNLKGKKIVELGSGWGTLAFPIAKYHPQCAVFAYEISFLPWMVSKVIHLMKGPANLKIIRQDFFSVQLKDMDVVVCYLFPGAMRKLKEKFEEELRSGTVVISNTFAIPGWEPSSVEFLDDIYHTPIYTYII